MVYVVDAGGNDVLKVDPTTGDVTRLRSFRVSRASRPIRTAGGSMEIDAVPTGLAWRRTAALMRDSSRRSVHPGHSGTRARCHGWHGLLRLPAAHHVGDVAVADGSVYVVTISDNFIDAAGPRQSRSEGESGDGTSMTVLSGILFPAGIAFDPDGNAYITAMASLRPAFWLVGMASKCTADAFQMMTIQPVGAARRQLRPADSAEEIIDSHRARPSGAPVFTPSSDDVGAIALDLTTTRSISPGRAMCRYRSPWRGEHHAVRDIQGWG